MCINKNAELLPYYEKARDIFNYCQSTGVFTWKHDGTSRQKFKAGDKAGSKIPSGYIILSVNINKNKKRLYAHRVAWFILNETLPEVIDHTNGIKDDNRKANIRSCSQSQNLMNKKLRVDNKTGYRGVCFHSKSNKKPFSARIKIRRKEISLGYFSTPEEASEAYEAKAKELFGEFYRP